MRLLIITQIVDKNDPILGFFHAWVSALASQVNSIELVGLVVGEHDLPENVQVHSLGKETKPTNSLGYAWRLWKLSWQLRHDYDVVFAHMNPEYIVAGSPLWSLLRKPRTMWYAHGAVSLRLRLATLLCARVFTSTPNGFRLKSRKASIIGQGIDVAKFSPKSTSAKDKTLRLITVGRIAPAKHLETLITALATLLERGVDCHLDMIGLAATASERAYEKTLRDQAVKFGVLEHLTFSGPVPQDQLPSRLIEADIFVSDGSTGSLDKVLLEAMASELMVISSNASFAKLAPFSSSTTFLPHDGRMLAERVITYVKAAPEGQNEIRKALRAEVTQNHSLDNFVTKLVTELNTVL